MNIIRKLTFLILIAIMTNITCPNISGAITIPKENEQHTEINKFLGKWNMQTIVIDSSCPFVLVGTTTESNLEIEPLDEKKSLKAFWEGGNWTSSTGTIKLLNKKEAITERVTEFISNDRNNWKAILIDHLKLSDNDTMQSESIVIQYKNGLAVGEYRTISILTKAD